MNKEVSFLYISSMCRSSMWKLDMTVRCMQLFERIQTSCISALCTMRLMFHLQELSQASPIASNGLYMFSSLWYSLRGAHECSAYVCLPLNVSRSGNQCCVAYHEIFRVLLQYCTEEPVSTNMANNDLVAAHFYLHRKHDTKNNKYGFS
jgi:hypothetical protein